MAVAILIFNSMRGTDEQWVELLGQALPDDEVRSMDTLGDPAEIEFLVFGRPIFKDLPNLPNLKLMMTMLAGVDGLLGKTEVPGVPLTKTEPPGGDPLMTEYCLLQVLRHHRQMPAYQAQQREHNWSPLPQPKPHERTVGFFGYGTLAKPMTELIGSLGFHVIAWARTAKADAPIEVFHGAEGFRPFLTKTEIGVLMLPLNPHTREIVDREAFDAMPEGASIINLARGGLINHQDLISALDSGKLAGATLDVTEPEPLPEDSPLWDHPKITIMPHVARRPPAEQLVPQVVDNIRRFRAGEPLQQVVDWSRGY